jgi:hypothetical protein
MRPLDLGMVLMDGLEVTLWGVELIMLAAILVLDFAMWRDGRRMR